MAINMSSSFEERIKKLKGAKARGGGNWIKGDGVFEVELISAKRMMALDKDALKTGRQVRNKEQFIAEFRIRTSTVPDLHSPGSTASWVLRDPSDETAGAGDLKDFCFAILGVEPRSVKDSDDEAHQEAAALSLAALGEDEAFKFLEIPPDFFTGKRLRLETKTVTKKNGDPFTKHVWSPSAVS